MGKVFLLSETPLLFRQLASLAVAAAEKVPVQVASTDQKMKQIAQALSRAIHEIRDRVKAISSLRCRAVINICSSLRITWIRDKLYQPDRKFHLAYLGKSR